MISTQKNLSQTICRTLGVRKTKFRILCGVCCYKKSNHSQMVSDQYNKHEIQNVIKIMIQTMLIRWSKQLIICESKNKRDGEKEYTKIYLGSSPIDLFGYVFPQFEFELRYYYNKSYFANVCIQEKRDQVPQTLSLFLTLAPPKNLDQSWSIN
jgi:hypothetical protein